LHHVICNAEDLVHRLAERGQAIQPEIGLEPDKVFKGRQDHLPEGFGFVRLATIHKVQLKFAPPQPVADEFKPDNPYGLRCVDFSPAGQQFRPRFLSPF
jgi:hypothetical protein